MTGKGEYGLKVGRQENRDWTSGAIAEHQSVEPTAYIRTLEVDQLLQVTYLFDNHITEEMH